jgi:hypothetical protein
MFLRIEPPQQKIPCSMALRLMLARISTPPSQGNSHWIEFANHCLPILEKFSPGIVKQPFLGT